MMLITALWISCYVFSQQLVTVKPDGSEVPNQTEPFLLTTFIVDNENDTKSELFSTEKTLTTSIEPIEESNLRTNSDNTFNLLCSNVQNCIEETSSSSPSAQISTVSKITWNPVQVLKVSTEELSLSTNDSNLNTEYPPTNSTNVEQHSTSQIPFQDISTIHPNDISKFEANELDAEVREFIHDVSLSQRTTVSTTLGETVSSIEPAEETVARVFDSNDDNDFLQTNTDSITRFQTESTLHSVRQTSNVSAQISSNNFVATSEDSVAEIQNEAVNSHKIVENTTAFPSDIAETILHAELESESFPPEESNILITTRSSQLSKQLNFDEVSANPNIYVTTEKKEEKLNMTARESGDNGITPLPLSFLETQNADNNLTTTESTSISTAFTEVDNLTSTIQKTVEETNEEEISTSSLSGTHDVSAMDLNADESFLEEIYSSTQNLLLTQTTTSINYTEEPLHVNWFSKESPFEKGTTTNLMIDSSDVESAREDSTQFPSDVNHDEATTSQSIMARSNLPLTDISDEITTSDQSTEDTDSFISNNTFEITEQIFEETSTQNSFDYVSDLISDPSNLITTVKNYEETESTHSKTDEDFSIYGDSSEMENSTTHEPIISRTPEMNNEIITGLSFNEIITVPSNEESTFEDSSKHSSETSVDFNETTIQHHSEKDSDLSIIIFSTSTPVENSTEEILHGTRSIPIDYLDPIENISESIPRNITHLVKEGQNTASSIEDEMSSLEEEFRSSTPSRTTSIPEIDVDLASSDVPSTDFSDTSFSMTEIILPDEEDKTTVPPMIHPVEPVEDITTIATETSSSSQFATATHREGKHIPFSTVNTKSKTEEKTAGISVVTPTTFLASEATEGSYRVPLDQREYEDLTSEEKTSILTAIIQLPSQYNSEDDINEKIVSVHQWIHHTLLKGYQSTTMHSLDVDKKFEDHTRIYDPLHIVYVLPTPEVHFSNITFTFYIYNNITNETFPADFAYSLFKSNSEELRLLVNANETYFYYGLLPGEHDFLTIIIEKYGTIVAATCLAALTLVLLLVCVVIYYRRKTRYSTHCLANDKLHRNMQEAMGLDLNPAVVILQDELKEKALNGNKICSLDDNEGWLVPFTDVPVAEDKDAPRVQDTKL